MKNIVDELYDLHLSHHDTDNEDSKYQSTLDRLIKLKAKLLKTYPDYKEILEEFQTRAVISTALQIAMSSARVSK